MSPRPQPPGQIPAYGPTVTLLVLLVAVDFLFIAVHALHVWSPWLGNHDYSMDSYDGMASIYQYIKQIWLAGCLALAYLQTRNKVFVGWTLLFAYLLLDDALELHELLGEMIASWLGLPAMLGLRPRDLGEILVAAAIGCVALGLVGIAFRRGGNEARELSADLMCLLAALAVFGVFFDTLHTITYFKAPSVTEFIALVEDGGELLVISVITAYTFDLTSNAGRPRLGVWTWVRSAVSRG